MKYVYILQSVEFPDRYYVGVTSDLKSRLAKHNAGEVSHTSKYVPWSLKTYVAFSDEAQAFAFEKYLKSASGRKDSNCPDRNSRQAACAARRRLALTSRR